jgi:hypothetical protein
MTDWLSWLFFFCGTFGAVLIAWLVWDFIHMMGRWK